MAVPSPAISVLAAIGNTPAVKLRRIVPPGSADVYVKLEYYNPTGSYKDRMALAMIEGAEQRGALRPGMRVVEFTGGSTGSSLALICAVKGYQFVAVSSDAFSVEKLRTIQAFGADLRVIPAPGGTISHELFKLMRAEAERLTAEGNSYYTSQFENQDALRGYMGIGEELLKQLGGKLDAFCGGVGTGGMLTGVGRALRASQSKARIVALEPASSPVLTAGKTGSHHIEGIGPGFVAPHLQAQEYDEARAIDEAEARAMVRRMAKEEGIFAGTSSGMNVTAALQLAQELGSGHLVATVAVDSGLKYLAGELYR